MIRTFAIESSCDDTSISIVSLKQDKFYVEKIFSQSQIDIHNKYWWVVPELASRLHSINFLNLIDMIWIKSIKKCDFISVTWFPWLSWSLQIWINFAYMIWNFFNKKVLEIDHIKWHLSSVFIERNYKKFCYPTLVLSVSWWHNDIYLLDYNVWKDKFKIKHLWSSLDDSAWECFDKISRALWWPYPWWAWIEQNAKNWKPNQQILLKRPYLSKEKYMFSFSWIKTSLTKKIEKFKQQKILTQDLINDIWLELQQTIIDVFYKKILNWINEFWIKNLFFVWWVSSSDIIYETIQTRLNEKFKWKNKIEVFRPTKKSYSTDNWAMIWVAGILKFKNILK